MDPAYGARYRDLYERHWWWRTREALVVGVLERWRPPAGFGRVLDVGCGDGLFFDRLRRFGEPEGVEVDASLVTEIGRSRGPIHLGTLDDYHPPHRFGLITLLDVLEHLDDDVAGLKRLAELLEPEGRLVINVPAFRVLWTAHDDFNHHRTRYTVRSLRRAIAAAGLSLLWRRYTFQWLFALKLAVRLKEKLLPAAPEMASVPGPPWNGLARTVCRLEQTTWGRVPWPFGTSLMAVCGLSGPG